MIETDTANDRYARAAAYADRIEAELRRLNVWQQEPLAPEAYDFRAAFAGDTMTLYQWLQFILLPRIRHIVESRGGFPMGSHVGAYAVRELDGHWEASGLVSLLSEFDSFICSL